MLDKITPSSICLSSKITWKILAVNKTLLDQRFKRVFLACSYHEMSFSCEISPHTDILTEVASA